MIRRHAWAGTPGRVPSQTQLDGVTGDHMPSHCSAPHASNRSTSVNPSSAARRIEPTLAVWVASTTGSPGSAPHEPAECRRARLGGVPESPRPRQEQVAEIGLPHGSRATVLRCSPEQDLADHRPVEINDEAPGPPLGRPGHLALKLVTRPRAAEVGVHLQRGEQLNERRTVPGLGLSEHEPLGPYRLRRPSHGSQIFHPRTLTGGQTNQTETLDSTWIRTTPNSTQHLAPQKNSVGMGPGFGLAPGGMDGAEEIEGLGAGAAWFGVVDDELLAGGVAYVEGLVGEREGADVRVEELLRVLGLAAHGVGVPEAGEVRAVLGEGADEFAQPWVVRLEAGRLAQIGDGGLGRPVPVRVEVPPRGRGRSCGPGCPCGSNGT